MFLTSDTLAGLSAWGEVGASTEPPFGQPWCSGPANERKRADASHKELTKKDNLNTASGAPEVDKDLFIVIALENSLLR